jgi:hypothetical protein
LHVLQSPVWQVNEVPGVQQSVVAVQAANEIRFYLRSEVMNKPLKSLHGGLQNPLWQVLDPQQVSPAAQASLRATHVGLQNPAWQVSVPQQVSPATHAVLVALQGSLQNPFWQVFPSQQKSSPAQGAN